MLIDDFKTRFPQFDTTLVDLLWPSIDGSWSCFFNFPYVEGDCNAEAILNLTAHLFVVESQINDGAGGGGQPSPTKSIASQSVGNVSVSYAIPTTATDRTVFFNSTIYGQKFLMLSSSTRGAMFV